MCLNARTMGDPKYFEARFGVTNEQIRKVLSAALERGGGFSELFFQHARNTGVGLEDGVVNRAGSSVDLGVGVRVVVGDRTGYAFSEDLSLPAMLAAARTASGIASGGASREPGSLTPVRLPSHYDTDYDWSTVGVDRITPVLASIDELARRADPRVAKVQASFVGHQSTILIVTSDGRIVADEQPMTRLGLNVVMEQGGARQSNSHNLAARAGMDTYTSESVRNLVDVAIERTGVLFDAVRPPQGELPVVLAAGSSGILLHEAIGHGMEADFNRKGVSIFSDRIGRPVAQPFVSIVDDGTHQALRGSINVDDEGTPSERTLLVEEGVLRSYLHDRISAGHFEVSSTGSGRRESFRHIPLPRMRNTYMLPGPHTKEEVIANVKKGVYCISFTNGQVNIGAGDYTFYVKNGWLIEDGKLTAPLKDVNIIGNGPETLSRITMVGDDLEIDKGGWTCGKDGQGVPVSLGMPTCLVSSITVGGSA